MNEEERRVYEYCRNVAHTKQLELRKCPFCGGEATVKNHSTFKMDYDDYNVSCTKCGATIETKLLTREEAIKVWNNRTNDNEVVKQIVEFLVGRYGIDGVKIC